MKVKPWTVEENRKLRELVKSGASIEKIAAALEKSEASVRAKIRQLKLKLEEEHANFQFSSSSNVYLESELPSVEETLKLLNAARAKLVRLIKLWVCCCR